MLKHAASIFIVTLISTVAIHMLLLSNDVGLVSENTQSAAASEALQATLVPIDSLKEPNADYQALLAEIESLKASHLQLQQELERIRSPHSEQSEHKTDISEEALLVMENQLQQVFEDKQTAHFQEPQDDNNQAIMEQSLANLERRFNDLNIDHIRIDSTDCNTSTCIVEFIHETDNAFFNVALLGLENTQGVSIKRGSINGIEKTIAIYRLN